MRPDLFLHTIVTIILLFALRRLLGSWKVSIAIALAMQLGKEVYDYCFDNTNIDPIDWLGDLLGLVVGLIILKIKKYSIKPIPHIIIFLLAICSANAQSQVSRYALTGTSVKKIHKITYWDAGALTCAIASGLGRGVTNALRKNQGSLQRYLGVGDYDWGGRLDWERNYEGNRYWNEDTNAPNKHKTEVLGNFGRDAWHTADETTKWGDRLGTACFVVGSAIQIHRVAKASYASPTDRKKAIRKRIILCAVKGATVWAISSITEKRTFYAITQ